MDQVQHDGELEVAAVALLGLHAELDDLLALALDGFRLTPHGADDVQRAGEDLVRQLSVARSGLVPGCPGVALELLVGELLVRLKAAAGAGPLMRVAVDDQHAITGLLSRGDRINVAFRRIGRM
ncbi:hypothetical protein D3C85_1532480 [compost metagenome]